MEHNNHNFTYVSVSWLNYAVHYALSEPVLQKVALLGSIASSAVYIYIAYKKNKTNNDEEAN